MLLPTRALRRLVIAGSLTGIAPVADAGAQPRAGVSVRVVPSTVTSRGPVVATVGVLRDRTIRESIDNGFPARLHYKVGLWQQRRGFERFIDDTTFTLFVEFLPIDRQYLIRREIGSKRDVDGPYATLEQVDSVLALGVEAPIVAPLESVRMYYTVKLQVERIRWSDIDEIEDWLRGSVGAAVRGEKSVLDPIVNGVRRVFLSFLGGSGQAYQGDSETFVPR